MSLLSDMSFAADATRMQAGGKSLFDTAYDAVTKAPVAATASALAGFYNTGAWYARKVFDQDVEDVQVTSMLEDFDANYVSYYQDNKNVLDTVGFVGGALVPGGAALKGLQLARAGKAGAGMAKILGYTSNQQTRYLKAALEEVGQTGGTVFHQLNMNKTMALAYGLVDNFVQTAVFETAAAGFLHQAPMLAGEDWKDVSWDIIKTSLAGGAFAGAIEGLLVNRIYKDAGKLVDSRSRAYDTIASMEKMGLGIGDEAFSVMDELLKLPKEVRDADKAIDFSFKLNGGVHSMQLQTEALFDRKLQSTIDSAYLKFQKTLTNAVNADPTVGRDVSVSFVKMMQEGTKAGKTDQQLREMLGNYLFNLKSMSGLASEEVDLAKDVLYLIPGASVKSVAEIPFTLTTAKTSDIAQGYQIIGDIASTKLAVQGIDAQTAKQAWEAGFDVFIRATTGEVTISPVSKIYKKVSPQEDSTLRMVYNVRSMTTHDSALASIADVAMAGDKKLTVTTGGVSSGNYTFAMSVERFNPDMSALEVTARHLWASEKVKTLHGVTIDSRDFSLLDLLLKSPQLADENTMIRLADGRTMAFEDLTIGNGSYANWLKNQKVQAATEMFAKAKKKDELLDPRLVSYRLNTENAWVEKLTNESFSPNSGMEDGVFRPLESYAARDNVIFGYDRKTYEKMTADTGEDFIDPLISYHERVQSSVSRAQGIVAGVLGRDYEMLVDLTAQDLTRQADQAGAGSSLLAFANADYGDPVRAWAQDVGKTVNLLTQRRSNAALSTIQPHAAEILNDGKLAAELGAVVNRLRLTPEKTALFNGRIVDMASLKRYNSALSRSQAEADAVQFSISIPVNEKVYNFLQAHHELHRTQLKARKQLANAQGYVSDLDENALYVPPIDTKRVPFFAFVRAKEGKVFGNSEVVMVTAKKADELEQKIIAIREGHPDLMVLTKRDGDDYFKAKGLYDYSKTLSSPQIDDTLRRQGRLGDFYPTMEPKQVLEDFIEFHQRRERLIVQESVEVNYGQTFNELQWLSDRNRSVRESKFGFVQNLFGKTTVDPFMDYMYTALDVSKRSEVQLWHQMNEFVDGLGTRAYDMIAEASRNAKAGSITWQEANEIADRVGIGMPFKSQADYLLAQSGGDRNLIKQAIAKGNMLLANVTLRLDFANSLVNVISSPILLGTELQSIKNSIKDHPELTGKLAELTSVVDPVNGVAVPSKTKLVAGAIKNFFGPEKDALIGRYKEIGAIKDIVSQYHAMLSDLSLTPDLVPGKWAQRVDHWTEVGAKFTGNNFAEEFTRFVGADVMRQLTQPLVAAGRMSVKEQNMYIGIFVNRVHGNYIASQRPILFQGTLGAAIGLFQTYQFNLFQQLFRHIGNRDASTIAVMGGLQTTLFGLNGLPMFDAINSHLIGQASINEGHRDVYSTIASANKELGDWAMYGTASAFPLFSDKAPSLYTRGDLNPRHVTIVPTTFAQLPLVEASSRVVGNLISTGRNIINGADLGPALLEGLEHNGISRPLAGIAQSLQGYSTTSQGSLISAASDYGTIATLSRVAGAKPMDESIALNHRYRLRAYQAADQARTEKLGEVVKQKIRAGTLDSEDITEFAGKYAASGGRIEGYSAALQRWFKSAKQSDVNKLMQAHRSETGKRMLEVMGGKPLEDLLNTPPAE